MIEDKIIQFLIQNRRPIKFIVLIGLILYFTNIIGWAGNANQDIAGRTAVLGPTILKISKIKVEAPIILDVNGNNKEIYFKALEGGVAHFRGTAKPGEGSNIFIFGHSSFYPDRPGDYKEIFLSLADLSLDDEIIIYYQGKNYQYRVVETKIVEPTDVSVLKPTAQEQVTLMTCVPPGTVEKRLVVIGKPAN